MADVPVPKFSVISTPVPGKCRVVPTPKTIAVKAQKEAPKDDAMVIDTPAAQASPTIIVPPSCKCTAPTLPMEGAPSQAKLVRTSQSSLVQRTPSLASSTSSRPIAEDPPSVPSPSAPIPNLLLIMRLNMLEQSIHRNHQTLAEAMRRSYETLEESVCRNYEETLSRLAEMRGMYEGQIKKK
jgi:hypothetical protein